MLYLIGFEFRYSEWSKVLSLTKKWVFFFFLINKSTLNYSHRTLKDAGFLADKIKNRRYIGIVSIHFWFILFPLGIVFDRNGLSLNSANYQWPSEFLTYNSSLTLMWGTSGFYENNVSSNEFKINTSKKLNMS